jgi:hypothetical protein
MNANSFRRQAALTLIIAGSLFAAAIVLAILDRTP